MAQGREKNQQISQAEKELENFNSQAGQQTAKLRSLSSETARAWAWIQENQDRFEHPVYGPPILECSVKDPRYVDTIESLLQKNDFLAFTTQSRNDFQKLGACLYQELKLAEITIRTSSVGLDQFRAPVSRDELRSYGFDGWALDFVEGPEPVLAMLCSENRLHQTAVTLQNMSEQQYERLRDSPISSWVSGKSSYQITRRREYGPGATSTKVREVRKGQCWTDQPVDAGIQRELQANIQQWKAEVDDIQRQANGVNEKLQRLKSEAASLEKEKRELEEEKASKQRALSVYKQLPTKLGKGPLSCLPRYGFC